MCGCVCNVWVAGGGEKCVRGMRRQSLVAQMMMSIILGDALVPNNIGDYERLENNETELQ